MAKVKAWVKTSGTIKSDDIVRIKETGDIRKVGNINTRSNPSLYHVYGSYTKYTEGEIEKVRKVTLGDELVITNNTNLKAVNGNRVTVTNHPITNRFIVANNDVIQIYCHDKIHAFFFNCEDLQFLEEIPIYKPSRDELKQLVAELICLRLDESYSCNIDTWEDMGQVRIYDYTEGITLGEASLSSNDKWDTLTGVYVALMKAAGEPLPKWVTS